MKLYGCAGGDRHRKVIIIVVVVKRKGWIFDKDQFKNSMKKKLNLHFYPLLSLVLCDTLNFQIRWNVI